MNSENICGVLAALLIVALTAFACTGCAHDPGARVASPVMSDQVSRPVPTTDEQLAAEKAAKESAEALYQVYKARIMGELCKP